MIASLKDMFTRSIAVKIYHAVDFDPITVQELSAIVSCIRDALIVPFHIYNLEGALA